MLCVCVCVVCVCVCVYVCVCVCVCRLLKDSKPKRVFTTYTTTPTFFGADTPPMALLCGPKVSGRVRVVRVSVTVKVSDMVCVGLLG